MKVRGIPRINYIDFVKFIAIYCVAIGHSVEMSLEKASFFDKSMEAIICSFHMPLFAFVSGLFLTHGNSWIQDVKKKTIQILLPYIVWTTIFFLPEIYQKLHDSFYGIEPFHAFSIARNYVYTIIEWGAWFLRALFLCFIFALPCKGKRKNLLLIISLVFVLLCSFLGIFPNHHWSLLGFIFLYPFFITGKLMSDIILSEGINRTLLVISLIVWLALVPFWSMRDAFYDMNTSIFATTCDPKCPVLGMMVIYKTFYRYLIGISGSIAIVLAIKLVSSIKFWSNKFGNFCCNIGKYTLIIYMLQDSIIKKCVENLHVQGATRTLLLFVISLFSVISVYYIGRLFSKNKYTSLFLIGKVPR